MKAMMKRPPNGALDRLLNPLSDCFTPAMARRFVSFRADADTRARVQELADKCSEGELSPSERHEYEAYVKAIHLISILQSKARIVLVKKRKSR